MFTVGRIGAPHGVRGDLRLLPLTDYPDRFRPGLTLYPSPRVDRPGNGEKLVLEAIRPAQGFLVVRFLGIDSREAAVRLVGLYIQVPEEELVPLPAGSWYIYQLIGLEVTTENGRHLGHLREVISGANDVYVVERPDGRKLLWPATKEAVAAIEPELGRIVVRDIEELVEG